jgi:hypothetical protein
LSKRKKMKVIIRAAMVAALLCASIGMAGAQTKGQNASPAPGQSSPSNNQVQPNAGSSHGAPPGTLSRELDRSRGVIHPPPTGDGGVVTPMKQGKSSMPVIPPPGSPGGNPRVQPK